LCRPGTDRARELSALTNPDTVARSLPHFDENGREVLMRSYLGWTTWQALARSFSISNLPNTVYDL
jgi:hypothetical protein